MQSHRRNNVRGSQCSVSSCLLPQQYCGWAGSKTLAYHCTIRAQAVFMLLDPTYNLIFSETSQCSLEFSLEQTCWGLTQISIQWMLQEHSSWSAFRLAGFFPTAISLERLKFPSYCLILSNLAFTDSNKEFSIAFSGNWIKAWRMHVPNCLGFSRKNL